jgi:hypothetical protein
MAFESMPNDEIFVFAPSKALNFVIVDWMSNGEVGQGIA